MFENFSKINYYLNGQTLELTDIFKSIKINTSNSPDINTIKNNNFERPDQLSNTLYNNPKLFWVNLALNNIKNPFKEWARSSTTKLTQNSLDFDTKLFQFGNTSNYLPQTSNYFNTDERDSYLGISLSDIQQDDIIIFETGSGPLELKTYGAGILSAANSCGYPHFGQSDIPDNFLNRNNIVQISCGRNFTACLDDLGYIWAWGEDIGLETSGFVLNGRLYNSPSGGYKHIDTTHNKIIAVTSTGDFACFGSCDNFNFTGQADIKKSSWTSGQTLAGIGIKNDNTIVIFGPIVSTDSTAQYFSDVSCADDYCLGAVTGSANNIVIGFGSTGYFQQVGQNTFYSTKLAELQPISITDPLYPFTDNNYSIIRKNEQDVLELKIKNLEPFISPEKNSETFYRSDYSGVYSSGATDYNLLLGFTDKNPQSKDGYILNNSKILFKNSPLVKQLEYTSSATTGITYSYNYSLNYDENLKPTRPLDKKAYKENYLGITSINNVFFTADLQDYSYWDDETGTHNVYYDWCPTFYSTYKNNSPKTPFFGPIDKDSTGFYETQASTNLHLKYGEPEGISFVTYIASPDYIIEILQDGSLTVERGLDNKSKNEFFISNQTNDINLYNEYRNKRNIVHINGLSGPCTSMGGATFINSFGKIKTLSKTNEWAGYAITENGTPLTFTHNDYLFEEFANSVRDAYGLDPNADHPYLHIREAFQAPGGISFDYLESCVGGFWSGGLDVNKNLLIFGVTLELEEFFGYTGSGFVYNPGITADYIWLGRGSVTYIKNGKIDVIGNKHSPTYTGSPYNFLEIYGPFFPGGTITNAIKVVGPSYLPYGITFGVTGIPPICVLDSTNTLRTYGTTAGTEFSTIEVDRLFFQSNNFQFFYYNLTTLDPLYGELAENIIGGNRTFWFKMNTNGVFSDVKNIEGMENDCFVTRTDNSTFRVQASLNGGPLLPNVLFDLIHKNAFGITGSDLSACKHDYTATAYLYKNNKTGKFAAFDYYGNYRFPYYSYGTKFNDLQHNGVYYNPIQQQYNIKYYDECVYKNIHPGTGIKAADFKVGGIWYGDQADLYDGIGKSDNLLFGGYDETYSSRNSKYGLCKIWGNKRFLIYSEYKYFDWKLPWSIDISKAVVGDGFIVFAHPNKTVTFLYGTTPPHNNTLEKFVNFNGHEIYSDPDSYGFWRESVGSYGYSNGNWYILPQQGDLAGVTVYPVKYWGTNTVQNELPQNLRYIPSSLSCGPNHCCALVYTDDIDQQYYGLGNVVCWGTGSTVGALTPPSDLGVCLGVWAGWDHSCAYDSLGNLRCWGSNQYGQCDVPVSVNSGLIRDIVLGKYFSVALMFDGRLISWGLGLTGSEPPANWGFKTTPLNIETE